MSDSFRRVVVVTGGAGFIGSHLVEALLDEYDVLVVDDYSTGRQENLFDARNKANRLGRLLVCTAHDVSDSESLRDVSFALWNRFGREPWAIVNLASTSGIRWTGSAQVAYAATKAGVIQLSRVVAVQYAKKGIRVNTIVPGQLHTPMVETRLAGQRAGGDVAKLLEQRQARIPLPFMGDGRDTANAALYLASDEARFVTGTELIVDGGMSVRCG